MQQLIRLSVAILIMLVSFPAISQTVIIDNTEYTIKNPQTPAGKVFYNFTYLKDTTQPEYLYKEIYELDFGKTQSMFTSYSRKSNDSAMAADLMNQVKTASDPNHLDLTMRSSAFISADKYFTDNASSSVYTLKTISSALFYIKDTQPEISWKILDSTKKIKGNLCQKAVGESHGRTYTAWFCSDLPYAFGPRKLHGLPGLILEAYDEKREVVYTLGHIEKAAGGAIGLPGDAMPVTEEQYAKTIEAFRKNPAAFRGAHPASGTPVKSAMNNIDPSKIKSISVIKESPYGKTVRLKENNPVDLQ